jgi:hypothetical protein
MKRTLILFFSLLLNTISAESASTIFQPLQPLQQINGLNGVNSYNTNNTFLPSSSIDYSNISQIEEKIFGHVYEHQDILRRLSRIEKSIFNTTYPTATNQQRMDNIILNFNQFRKYPNISKNTLSRIESRIFNQDFRQNTPQRRIERLENKLFGAIQSGDMDTRYNALILAAKNYNYNNSNYMNPTSGFDWKNIAGNIGNTLLGGGMTGFTPPITPYYNNSNNSYENIYNSYPSGYGAYQGYRSNSGYYSNFKDYSTGTGVTILD